MKTESNFVLKIVIDGLIDRKIEDIIINNTSFVFTPEITKRLGVHLLIKDYKFLNYDIRVQFWWILSECPSFLRFIYYKSALKVILVGDTRYINDTIDLLRNKGQYFPNLIFPVFKKDFTKNILDYALIDAMNDIDSNFPLSDNDTIEPYIKGNKIEILETSLKYLREKRKIKKILKLTTKLADREESIKKLETEKEIFIKEKDELKNRLLKLQLELSKSHDPYYNLRQIIGHQLEQKINESDIIEFKSYLKPKDRIARTISAFCNRYALTEHDSYIVFGVNDLKDMPKDSSAEDRIIPLKEILKESKVSTFEEFQFKINKIAETHLSPCPDSCYSIGSLNMKGYKDIRKDKEIIYININRFTLDSPIFYTGKIYIRKNGQDKQASDEEIVQLTKKIRT